MGLGDSLWIKNGKTISFTVPYVFQAICIALTKQGEETVLSSVTHLCTFVCVSAHQYLVKVESTPSVLPVVSYGKIQLTLISNDDLNETFVLTMYVENSAWI